jgi:hypothetical protein
MEEDVLEYDESDEGVGLAEVGRVSNPSNTSLVIF